VSTLKSLMLDTLEFKGTFAGMKRPKKMTVYEYLWTDTNAVEEAGLGCRTFQVLCKLSGSTARDALEQAVEANGEKKLYFPSVVGADCDRYYKVKTQTLEMDPITASLWDAAFACFCEDGAVYVAATDTAVW